MMGSFIRYIIWFTLSIIAIVLGVLLGDYGAWYLSWILGTGMMLLIAALGGVLFEAQEEEKLKREGAAASSASNKATRKS
jgi:uncharacterized membrane protein